MYSRAVEGRTLTFASSGWTIDDTFVLYDKETESMWFPFPDEQGLTCVSGELADAFLPELEFEITRWEDWLFENPDSKAWR